jgi:uroporphyrinogen decarboxylase
MTSRERVIHALNFKPVDRVPKDLGGMASTSISAFAYPKLVKALGLPQRRCRVHDTSSMLAMPDMDVLDALGCDVVIIWDCVTNAFDEPDKWEDYDFNGRLSARVCDRSIFKDCKRRSKSAAGGGLIVRHRGYTYPLQNLQSNIFLAHQS